MKPGFGYRADIDGLRAIAVLSVIGSLVGSEFLADRAFKSILGAKEPAI